MLSIKGFYPHTLLLVVTLLLGWSSHTQAATDCNAVTEIPVGECQALLELYNSTNGPNWKNNTGWNQTNMPCSWFGIDCWFKPHVTDIVLSSNQLSGNIPDFSKLPELVHLHLESNQLSGNIPDFSKLPELNTLFLNSNQLSGSIPDFSNPRLVMLDLSDNLLSGNIPNFSNLPLLVDLWLSHNQLSGNIPNFSNLPKLNIFYLNSNQLSGNIPDFSNLPTLAYLVLESNQLTGNIPNFSNLPNLMVLNLSSNQLSGIIPNLKFTHIFANHAVVNIHVGNNCGLTAYDAAQESLLNSKDPDWQTRNPNCPVSTMTLTITKTGNGTVTSTPDGINCGTACTASYSTNTAVTLTATAETGYGFSSWSGDCSGTSNVATVTMDIAKTCVANFGTTPPPCTYGIAPASNSHGPNAETGVVNVTASVANCAWTATSNTNWATITSGNTGQGNGTITYSVTANSSPQSRNGTLTIADQTFTITQAGKEVVLVPDIRIEPTTLSFP